MSWNATLDSGRSSCPLARLRTVTPDKSCRRALARSVGPCLLAVRQLHIARPSFDSDRRRLHELGWPHSLFPPSSTVLPTVDMTAIPIFNAVQTQVLGSLLDAAFQAHSPAEVDEILAQLPASATAEHRASARLLAESAYTSLPGAMEALATQYPKSLSAANVGDLALTLTILSTRAGTLLLTGHASPFITLTVQQRESVLQSWKASRILLLRKAFRGFLAFAMFVAYTNVETCVKATGYPSGGDPNRAATVAARLKPSYPFKFEQVTEDFQVIETEVLVVGSGVGGGVASSQLASKGHKVLVVDKGFYIAPEDLYGTPAAGFRDLYENSGLMASESGSINLLAGSTFGGGGVVNWSASLVPQHFIRQDWGAARGLPHFLSKEFVESMDFVVKEMGVTNEHVVHNTPNRLLVDSATKLGYHSATIPQNTAGTVHDCGTCSFGCIYGEKQSGPVKWLRDAAQHGAKFLQNATVDRLLFAASASSPAPTQATLANFTPTSSRRRCVGALVKMADGKTAILLASKTVVVSAGSINSPAVLLRSGLKGSRIGKNLHLHPVSYITGYFPDAIEPWKGSIMTGLTNVAENRDGSYHGAKLEVNMSFPGGTAASFQGWSSSKQHKASMIQMKNSFTLISLARDRDSGRIVLDGERKARVEYDVSAYDALSILAGVIKGCEIFLIAGANRIVTTQTLVEDYIPAPGHAGLADPAWLAWIAKVEKAGVAPSWAGHGSAHQMGSNAMGTTPSNSAVDPRARVWGTESLYVCDASVFPTASGANPMMTNLALSHSIAQFIDQDLRAVTGTVVRASL